MKYSSPSNMMGKPDLNELTHLFYPQLEVLGEFKLVAADQMPSPYQELLNHQRHMTVTTEAYHNDLVEVEVLDKKMSEDLLTYARKIVLRRRSDAQVVLFGIVRLNFNYLDQAVRDKIIGEVAPLGKILIEHQVLREVELDTLWKIKPSEQLATYFPNRDVLYGRTAMIYCNGEPAIELLEIVSS